MYISLEFSLHGFQMQESNSRDVKWLVKELLSLTWQGYMSGTHVFVNLVNILLTHSS